MKRTLMLVAIALIIGFFIGRSRINDIDPIIKYVKGDTITDTITNIQADTVIIPKIICLPIKHDTIYVGDTFYITNITDTAAILADYILQRTYNETLFDNDTTGSLYVTAKVQYNKLGKLGYTYTPVSIRETYHSKSRFTPFIMASTNTYGNFGVGGGLYLNDIGFGVNYINNYNLDNRGFEFSILRKF